MEVYTVTYDDSYVKRIYIIAEDSETLAIIEAMRKETMTGRDGNVIYPEKSHFQSMKIAGVFARKRGVKAVID